MISPTRTERTSDSFVIDEFDEDQISWAEDSVPSDGEAREAQQQRRFKQRLTVPTSLASSSQKGSNSEVQSRTIRTPNNVRYEGPEFIMPSIRHPQPDGSSTRLGSESEFKLESPEFVRRRIASPSSRTMSSSSSPMRSTREGYYRMQTPNSSSAAPTSSAHIPSGSSGGRHAKSGRKEAEFTFGDRLLEIAQQSLEWILDVIGQTLKTLKKPISWCLAAYLFAALLTIVQNFLTSSFYSALSPVCRIPGASFLNLPICQSSYHQYHSDLPSISSSPSSPSSSSKSNPAVAPNPEFDSLMKVQSQFEDIVTSSSSAEGISLPLDMKRSETSIRDLRQVVRYSAMPIPSRNELLLEFDGFIETARTASYDLQKFNSHVGRGVDIVLSTARWTQRMLDDIQQSTPSSSSASASYFSSVGYIVSSFGEYVLSPFRPLSFTESRLLEIYVQHTHVVGSEIEKLIDEATTLLAVLQSLEDRLDVIYSIVSRDDMDLQITRDEVLSQLWTMLGGNRAELGRYNRQILLLRQVGEYRRRAFARVAETVLRLQAMGAELEELRSRVGEAEMLRDDGAEAGSVGKGRGRGKIPLSVHLESIRLGVERLEVGRTRAREAETEQRRRVLDSPGRELQIEGGSEDRGRYIDR